MNISLQDNKLEVNRIVEEIYSKIQHTINSIDASDRVLVAIIKALISLNNEPSSPRQLAACIQKYGFTQLGGQTPYATVSGHISTHFSRVRNQVVPNPIIGKQPHPTIAKRSLYYFLDPDNVLRDLLDEYFSIGESLQAQLTPSSPVKSESNISTISGSQYCAETPPTTPSSVKDIDEEEDDIINKSISDDEDTKTYKTEVELPSAPHGTMDGVIGKKNVIEGINGVTPPSSPPNYLTFPQYLPEITPRNPGSPRVPLNPDVYIMKINGLEVFTTKIKTSQNIITLLRRVDNNYVDKYLLLQAGEQRPRNSDRKWITLEEAQMLAIELNIDQKLGIFLYSRLSDYFDFDLDYATISNSCCYPLAYWFQCVNPKIFAE
ncbi:hypothetical protein BCR41DRAFT_369590 [Rhizophagus clarus]|uniref:GDS1 winged helix domain-containing protein n=1 Tax=Rhizophagus clarus TaxID=94130 RepID=A0A8H3LC11_9GLOM|nr:hypothetical protein BCR41DRAFT_369590 [Rhizophagus clarus]